MRHRKRRKKFSAYWDSLKLSHVSAVLVSKEELKGRGKKWKSKKKKMAENIPNMLKCIKPQTHDEK